MYAVSHFFEGLLWHFTLTPLLANLFTVLPQKQLFRTNTNPSLVRRRYCVDGPTILTGS
jgi:hypothetical protein